MDTKSSDPTIHEAHRQTAAETVAALHTDARRGLSGAEAERRLARDGRNELDTVPPRPEWLKFLDQFTDVLVLLLIAAAAILLGNTRTARLRAATTSSFTARHA